MLLTLQGLEQDLCSAFELSILRETTRMSVFADRARLLLGSTERLKLFLTNSIHVVVGSSVGKISILVEQLRLGILRIWRGSAVVLGGAVA